MADIPPPFGATGTRGPSLDAFAESEQSFRKLVEALPDAILIHSEEKIVFINPFGLRLLGAKGPEQLLGRSISEIVCPEYLPQIRNRVRNCHSTGLASPPMEQVLVACDGSAVEVEAVAIPISWNGSPAIEVVLRDIAVRKRAQRTAEEWQSRLELAQKAGLRIGLWDWDLEANAVTWSDESYQQFGYTRDSFSGRVDEAIARMHPEDRPKVEAALQKVRAEHGEYAAQYRLVRPDGSLCWIDAHGVMVRGGSPHMIGIGVDITDLKRAEKSLLQSEEKYLLLLNSTAEAIYGLDVEGNCTFCNPATVRLLGHSSQALLGRNMHALIHHSRPDGTPYPERECEMYAAVREGRASHVTHKVLWRADGTSFPAQFWSYPMYKAGELVGAVVTFLDISDRRRAEEALQQSEEKYRHLFDNAIFGIFRSAVNGELWDVNPAMVSMLGYSSKEELLALNLNTDIYEDAMVRWSVLERYGPRGRVDGAEVNWKRKDGKIIAVRLCGGAVRNDDSSVSHYEVIAEDITARRELEEQLRHAQKMEALGLLAGGISHDFNNLLSVILGNAELLLDTTKQSETQRHYAEEIKKASRLAAQLTRQLLAFSRKEVLSPTVLDLNGVVQDVCKILERVLGEDIRIATELSANLSAIRADRGQIEQLLMNLATNARDAMPVGGTFTISTESMEIGPHNATLYPDILPGRYARLSVSDTGVGMSEELRARIFEPFFTTKPLGRGTGLGLATVYGVVKNSGGFIRVSSMPGAGTTFLIHLPCVEKKAVSPNLDLSVGNDGAGQRAMVLVLEDEEPVRLVTSEFLAAAGYRVLQAGSGYRAIEVARQYQGPIHLIISDVVLPDINGPAAVIDVQALHPETQALYVSGYAEDAAAQQLIAEGAVFLQKPVSRRDFLAKVEEMLHLASAGGS